MKTTIVFIISSLLFSLVSLGQSIVIDETVKVDSTVVTFRSSNINYTAYSTIDNKKPDSLQVNIESIGLMGYVLNINFMTPISIRFIIYSDGNEFDGKHHMDVELESYELTINEDKLKLGDKLMGTISGKTKEFSIGSSKYEISFDGYFNHIIGKVLRKRFEEDAYDSFDPRHY